GARRGGHRQGPQLPRSDELDGRRHVVEHHLNLAADQVGQRRRPAAIRDVHHVDAGHILNSSPDTWMVEPAPEDAMLSLPGLAFPKAMSSGTVLAGTDGFTTITLGKRMRPATGAMSRMKLWLSFS